MTRENRDLLINFYKPSGVGSTEFLNIAKRRLNCQKAGYAGTLDPMASGVLLVGLNKATKQLQTVANLNKQYFVQILFGVQTDTGDVTGIVERTSETFERDLGAIQRAIDGFRREPYWQTPPKYSAVNVNGMRAHELARMNVPFELRPREVRIYRCEIVQFRLPVLSLLLDVSKGFYVRQFAADLAERLGTCATCKKIVRTKCGGYELKDAKILPGLEPFPYD